MSDDFFDTSHEEQDLEIDDNFIFQGDDLNITAKDPTLHTILIGAGWDLNAFNADAIDLDLSIFLLDRNGQTQADQDFIFYNQTDANDGAIKHNGDSRTGAGDGDDESITIDLRGVSFDVIQIPVVISIYKGYEKEQNLGMVRGMYIRVVNFENGHELCRFELDELLAEKTEIGMIAGYINREGPKWHFKADIEMVPGGLAKIAERYGLIIKAE